MKILDITLTLKQNNYETLDSKRPEYPIKPDRYVTEHYVFFNGDDWWNIDSDLFPEVTFENSPMEVELKFIEK